MTREAEFLRTLEDWLREDGHEDPGRVLARVTQTIAYQPQGGGWQWPARLERLGRSAGALMTAAAALVIALALMSLYLLRPPAVGPNPSPSPSTAPAPSGSASPTPPAPTATPSMVDPAAPAIANDEPCTRTLPGDSLAVTTTPVHHEDLERMVLGRDDVGGLGGLEPDVGSQGYHDNAELTMIQVNPPTTCEDVRRFGRIEGYGNVYTDYGDGRSVMFAVHLFWTAQDAAAWSSAFMEGMAAGAADGGYTWTSEPIPELPDAVLATHMAAGVTRTWAILQRGPVIGWIVDVRPTGAQLIDVQDAAKRMAGRIDGVLVDVIRRVGGLDVARLLSAPLPLAAYGDLAEGLAWDPWFGGCRDTAEIGFISGDTAAADAARFGRVSGCVAMYDPPDGGAGRVVRVFSGVSVYGDANGAAAAIEADLGELVARGGVRFDPGTLGDQAIGVATPAGGAAGDEAAPADTRVVARIGKLTLSVVVQGTAAIGQQALLIDLARLLEGRVTTLLRMTG